MTSASSASHVSPALGALAACVGGALGAVARWGLTSAFPAATGHFPWTTLLINVVGSGLLAALPLLPAARRRAWLGIFVGTGILGGFTTMSAASVETLTLLRADEVLLAAAYCLGTLAAALVAVLLVDRWGTDTDRTRARDERWDT